MSDISSVRNEAKEFATAHVLALAQEIIAWNDSGTLPDGKLRELATIWAAADKGYSLELAEKSAVRAALEFVVRRGADDAD